MSEKKVLIITYYWPPSGGGGVQRWLKMSKYLPDFGWNPIIFTPKNPDFELKDESLLGDVPSGVEVIKLPIWEPFGLYRKITGKKAVQKQGVVDKNDTSIIGKLSKWIRGNWFIPDPRIFWVRPAVGYLTRYLSNNPVDVIITTGPPHSMHLVGMELKKRTGIKWIADFRDPWTDWDVLPQLNLNKKAWRYHRKLEHEVMHSADVVLTVTNRLAKQLKKTGGIPKVEVITNGFDAEDFKENHIEKPDKFRIAHVGLLNEGRNPERLWEALNRLCAGSEKFNIQLEVILAGTIEQSVKDSINSFSHLSSKVKIPEYLSHNEVLALYNNSAVLLLLVNNTSNSPWILPGKLFEYLSAKRPILAFGQLDSEANDVMKQCGHDGFFTFDEYVEAIEKQVLGLFNTYENNLLDIESDKTDLYERKKLTGDLADLLNQLGS